MKGSPDAILRADQARYLAGLEPPRDPLLAEMEADAAARDLPISDPEVASFLAVTARACAGGAAPRLIVEVGTNIGYGAIVLARAAGPEARVVSIESSAAHCDAARAYIARGGLSAQIEVRQGLALDELRRLATEGARIDLAYVDCVKEEYVQYLALLVPCLAERGVIIADNVLWRGHVAAAEVPEKERVRTQALRSFNEALVAHPALRSVILPLGDGVAFAVKR